VANLLLAVSALSLFLSGHLLTTRCSTVLDNPLSPSAAALSTKHRPRMPHIRKAASPSRSKSPIQLDAGLGDQTPTLRGFVKSEPDLGSPDSFPKRGKGRKRKDTEQTPKAEESLIGVRVLKKFGNVWYIGTVQSYTQECGMWRILYEDGDTEDLDVASVQKVSISEVDARKVCRFRIHIMSMYLSCEIGESGHPGCPFGTCFPGSLCCPLAT